MSEYACTGTDEFISDQGYLCYLAGASMLHKPETVADKYEVERDQDLLLDEATKLMLAGLTKVIRYAHPINQRSDLKALEHSYDKAAPLMRCSLGRVMTLEAERVKELSPALFQLRPAAMLNPTVYRYICHSRRDKLTIEALLDGVPPSPVLEPVTGLKLLELEQVF